MEKSELNATVAELINMCRESYRNESFLPDNDFLEKHELSLERWKCFMELIRDLDLNESGVKILLQEIRAGRYILKCDR